MLEAVLVNISVTFSPNSPIFCGLIQTFFDAESRSKADMYNPEKVQARPMTKMKTSVSLSNHVIVDHLSCRWKMHGRIIDRGTPARLPVKAMRSAK